MIENNEEQSFEGVEMLYDSMVALAPNPEEIEGMPLQLQFHTGFTLSLLTALGVLVRTIFNKPVVYIGELNISKEGISLNGTLGHY